MKKAIKNWLFKEELQELENLKQDLKSYPTHDLMSDFVHGVIYDQSYVSESDVEEKFEDVVYSGDLYWQLQNNGVVFEDALSELVTEDDLDDHISSAIDAIEWSEIIGEEVNRVFNARAQDVVKQVLKDIPGYFMYEQIKRYVEEDYVKWDHYSLNFDDLAQQVSDIQEFNDKVEAFQAPGFDKAIFFANFKDAIRKLLDETNILPGDE
jgi:uncharacterized protein CbrC (UPF0167 family)